MKTVEFKWNGWFWSCAVFVDGVHSGNLYTEMTETHDQWIRRIAAKTGIPSDKVWDAWEKFHKEINQ